MFSPHSIPVAIIKTCYTRGETVDSMKALQMEKTGV